MARVLGTFTTASNYDITSRKPFDARMLVPSYADLLDSANWTANGKIIAFNGMIVAVANTSDTTQNGIYYLFDPACTSALKSPGVTSADNWHKLAELTELNVLADRITALEGADTTGITDEQLNDAINALRTEITNAGYITADALTDYALKSDLPDISTKADAEHTHAFGDITNAPDMSNYYDKSAVDAAIATKADAQVVSSLSAVVDTKANATDLAGKADAEHRHDVSDIDGYIAPDLDSKADKEHTHEEYALKTDIPSVPTKVSDLEQDIPYLTEHQSLDGKADVEHTHKFADITDAPNMDEYAKVSDLDSKANAEHEHEAYALKTDIPDISGKSDVGHTHTISEIADYKEPDFTGYATEEFVTAKIAEAELADKEVDLSAYYTKTEVDGLIPTKISDLANDAGYLTAHQDISGKADKTEVDALVERVDAAETAIAGKADATHMHTLSEISDYVAPEIPSLDGYATEEFVNSAVADKATTETVTELSDRVGTIEVTKANTSDLANYATNKSVENLSYELNTALEAKADASTMNTVSADVEVLKAENASQSTKLDELQSQIDVLSGIEGSLADFATDEEVEAAVKTALQNNTAILYGTF